MHVLQTVPPSCLNRDDTGSPKTAIYGGVQRARVSSQSWKRAIREMFRDNFDESKLGVRTKKIVELVAEKIEAADPLLGHEVALEKAEGILNAAGVTTKNGEAKALFFMGAKQAENLAVLALQEEKPDKKTIQLALKKGSAIDIALFGRMVADDPNLNTDASAQVAHAISTHRVDIEYDYFTAVDDRAPEDNAGAGMIGTIEFDSATLYRYATVAVHELCSQLSQDHDVTAQAVEEFVRAFVTSMPTGKQNTFANRTPADAVLLCLRTDQPVNLAGAFEEPVKASDKGLVAPSISKLVEYSTQLYGAMLDAPIIAWAVGTGLGALGKELSLADAINELDAGLKEMLPSASSEKTLEDEA